MPWKEDKSHHCKPCGEGRKKLKSQHGGVCKIHQHNCPQHPLWWFYKTESCEKCDEEARAEIEAARKLKAKQEKEGRKKEKNAFFEETGRARKPRTKEKYLKKQNGGENGGENGGQDEGGNGEDGGEENDGENDEE